MIVVCLTWFLLAGAYLVLAGTVSADEAGAAVLGATLGAVWVWQIGRCADHALAVRIAALRPLPSTLAALPGQTVRVAARLLRAAIRGDVAGESRTVPPEQAARCPLEGEDPRAAGARAVAVLATSLSPDTYVLRLEPARGRVLVHALLPAEGRSP